MKIFSFKIHDLTSIVISLFFCVMSYVYIFACMTTIEATYINNVISLCFSFIVILLSGLQIIFRIRKIKITYLFMNILLVIASVISLFMSLSNIIEGIKRGYLLT